MSNATAINKAYDIMSKGDSVCVHLHAVAVGSEIFGTFILVRKGYHGVHAAVLTQYTWSNDVHEWLMGDIVCLTNDAIDAIASFREDVA